MGAFGEKFRKARESKEFSFDDVSNVIKISPRMLRAIEEENFDQLPGGVFNKGFIRSYAKHLGLDPEEAVAEYLEQIRQAQIQAQEAWQPPAVAEKHASAGKKPATGKDAAAKSAPSTPAGHTAVEVPELPELQLPRAEHVRRNKKEFLDRPSLDIPWKIVAVAIVIVILGSVLWFRHAHRRPAISATPAQVAVSTPATASPSPSNGLSSAPSSATPNVVAPNASEPAASATPDSATNNDKTDNDKSDVTVRNFGKPLPKSVEKFSGSLALTVRATENSWISVTADGQPLTEETLIAPAHPTYRASRDFVVKVGNAAAISFVWNGHELPAQGGEGEVKTLFFDANGMRAASPAQAAPAAQPPANQ